MHDVLAQRLPDRSGIRIVPIRRHPVRHLPCYVHRLPEETLGGVHIAMFAEHGVNEVAIPINGAIEIFPLPVDLDVNSWNANDKRALLPLWSLSARHTGSPPSHPRQAHSRSATLPVSFVAQNPALRASVQPVHKNPQSQRLTSRYPRAAALAPPTGLSNRVCIWWPAWY